jgi:hypothetical protein
MRRASEKWPAPELSVEGESLACKLALHVEARGQERVSQQVNTIHTIGIIGSLDVAQFAAGAPFHVEQGTYEVSVQNEDCQAAVDRNATITVYQPFVSPTDVSMKNLVREMAGTALLFGSGLSLLILWFRSRKRSHR